nr:linker for activation of T-cells family member 2 isoform X1 [Zootoca vivipara]
MSQVELIWGAFSLMFLGALVSMCMKCQRTGGRQEQTGLDSQRNHYAEQQRFEAVRSCSMSRHDCPKIPCDLPGQSKRSKHPALASPLQACPEPRYQNIEKVLQMEQDPAYVKPIAADIYYNCGSFLRQSSDDDIHSYHNMAGPSRSSGLVLADVDVYENSTTIQIWKRSQIAEDSDDDEPDYINSNPNCRFPA